MASYYYGGVQIILGLVIAIPSLTIGTSGITIALLISLLLTGLYSVLGSKYLRDTQHTIEAYRDSNNNAIVLPMQHDRFQRLHYQFLCANLSTAIILIGLGLASFVQGTIAYFTQSDVSTSQGSTPAISGIAALLVNLFIAGCLLGEIRKARAADRTTDLPERPRSPTPRAGSSRPMEVSTIELRYGEPFPPSYSQINFPGKSTEEFEELPPAYGLVAADMPSTSHAGQSDGIWDASSEVIISPSHLEQPVAGLPLNEAPSFALAEEASSLSELDARVAEEPVSVSERTFSQSSTTLLIPASLD